MPISLPSQKKKTTKRKQNAEKRSKSVDKNLHEKGAGPSKPAKRPRMNAKLERQLKTTVNNLDLQLNELDENDESIIPQEKNLFYAQIQEFLNQLKVGPKLRAKVDAFVAVIRDYLFSLPEELYQSENETVSWLSSLNIVYPMKNPPTRSKVPKRFEFSPPISVDVVGSYRLNLATRHNLIVDVVVGLPSRRLPNNAYTDHLYHTIRAMYLSVLAAKLRDHSSVGAVEFSRFLGDPLKPCLIVTPKGNLSSLCRLQILLAPPEIIKNPPSLLPQVSNIRHGRYFGWAHLNEKSDSNGTPMYNHSIAIDRLLRNSWQSSIDPSLRNVLDGLMLACIWMKRRHLHEGFGGITSFLLRMILEHGLRKRTINLHVGADKVFHNFLTEIANSTWDVTGISMSNKPDQNVLEVFHRHFPVVFLNNVENFNYFGYCNISTYSRLKHEAKLALEMFDLRRPDLFMTLFQTPVSFLEKFDGFLKVECGCYLEAWLQETEQFAKIMDVNGNSCLAGSRKILQVLQQAFGERTTLIEQQRLSHPVYWKCSDRVPAIESSVMVFGLLLNSETHSRVIDRGPYADTPEAVEFRAFWGEKSDIRKFSDGSICEAVFWECQSELQRRRVPEKIAKFIFKKHFGIPESNVHLAYDMVTNLLLSKSLSQDVPPSTGEERFRELAAAYEKLEKILRSLEDLPLRVTNVQAVSSACRTTEVLPPLSSKLFIARADAAGKGNRMIPNASHPCAPFFIASQKVQLTLEVSKKWPNELKPFRHLKAAFYVKLHELLTKELQIVSSPLLNGLLVVIDSFVFRVTINHQKEIGLLKSSINRDETSTNGRLELTRMDDEMIKLPKHAMFISTFLHSHPSFSLSCRLAKRWISCHMLSDYVPDEAIELLVASIYLDSGVLTTPGTAMAGFMRFLRLLTSHDWLMAPLFLNTDGSLTVERKEQIEAKFRSLRPTYPPMCIVTTMDNSGCWWTRQHPSAVIMERVIALANASLDILRKQSFCPTRTSLQNIFRSSNNIYDVTICLNTSRVAKRYMPPLLKYEFSFDNTMVENNPLHVPVTDFDSVACFLTDLRNKYEKYALFFYDKYGGSVVGVLWKPYLLKLAENSRIDADETEQASDTKRALAPMMQDIIDDFSVVGNGIVSEVNVKSS